MKNQFSTDVQRLKLEMEYRNYSPSSVSSYCETMRVLEKVLKKPLSVITSDELKSYLQQLIVQQKCSVSYINQHISAFKIFQQDILKKDWEGIKIKRPRGVKTLPVVLSLEEVERMISSIRNLKTHFSKILTLGYESNPKDLNVKKFFFQYFRRNSFYL